MMEQAKLLHGDGDVPVSPGPRPRGSGRLRDEAGYILAMTGLLIIPLVVMTAFATDVGAWYAQGQKMQRAADAAALAGVVWTSDPANPMKWDTVARDTATRNGYTDGVNDVTVNVVKPPGTGNRVTVTISANGAQFFSQLFIPGGERLTRSATAEYTLPVPMGSPRNYIGTGGLAKGAVNTAYEPERMWMAVSGRCTDKMQGDQVAAAYFNMSSSGSSPNNTCSGTANPAYDDTNPGNYEYYIDLPAGRTYNTDVIIYNGNFVSNRGSCSSGGYTTGSQPNEFCPGGMNSMAAMSTTFNLYQADGTPLDDSDNPSMTTVSASNPSQGCGSTTAGLNGNKTFGPVNNSNNVEFNYTFNPDTTKFNNDTKGWWRMCTIPSSAPPGRYIMRVRNQDTMTGAAQQSNGSNAYSIVATPAVGSGPGQRLCDARSDVTCPKVYAKNYLSIYALANGTANFFLAEITSQQAGHTMKIGLWDSAEGAASIALLKPTGANSWAATPFDYSSTCYNTNTPGSSRTGVSIINNPSFNGCMLTLTVNLRNDYDPATQSGGNAWWRVQYAYGSSATDRTTWSVTILGDPVHLVG